MAGDELGYWLPDLLHHAASWGIVTICPALPGFIPVGDGDSTVASARLLSELQPCRSNAASKNVLVDAKKVAVAGYSLGGGRALRGVTGNSHPRIRHTRQLDPPHDARQRRIEQKPAGGGSRSAHTHAPDATHNHTHTNILSKDNC